MPRSKSNTPPKYLLHKRSGLARVIINRKDFYLGKHGTKESREKYYQVLEKHFFSKGEPDQRSIARVIHDNLQDGEPTVGELAVAYLDERQKYYVKDGKPTSELGIATLVMKRIRTTFGDILARDFGPLRYKEFRNKFVSENLCRTTIKHYMFHVKAMYRLAAENQLIPLSLYSDLENVSPLRKGKSSATEPRNIKPPNYEFVEQCLFEMTPVIRDMVEIQRLTAMRPGEVCILRPCDIDRSSNVWLYRPASFKTEHHETAEKRRIFIGNNAQAILAKYLLRDEYSYCFTPEQSFRQHLKARRIARKTPPKYGSDQTGNIKTQLERFKPRYSTETYRKAVQRAQQRVYRQMHSIVGALNDRQEKDFKANFRWFPNQLRHEGATKARAKVGLEGAQQVCGHSSKRTTEIYAEQNLELAEDFARECG